MFETSKPISTAFCSEENIEDPWVIEDDSHAKSQPDRRAGGGEALRAIEWRELTARLNAARELRRELRQEAILCAGASGATFGDAAAHYFKTIGDGERPVNPTALEGCKASCGTPSNNSGAAAKGDARDDL
ncbi:MAG: hypothetical protein AAF291_08855 [Pseudomonadota bacterium]